MNWNDLRYLLAVEQGGSLSAAAQVLRVNETTVSRRLKSLERTLGVTLMRRSAGRLVLSPAGEAASFRAQRMAGEAAALSDAFGREEDVPGGLVRMTAIPTVVEGCLVPHLAALRRRHPRLALELIAESGNLSLSRREADIAVRLARPVAGDLKIRKVAEMGFAVYAARARDPASLPDDFATGDWIVYDDSLAHLPEARWLAARIQPRQAAIRVNDLRVLVGAVRRGLGFAVLPCFAGDRYPDLHRLSGESPVVSREVWLLIHRQLREVTRVRAVWDWLIEVFGEESAALAGKAPGT